MNRLTSRVMLPLLLGAVFACTQTTNAGPGSFTPSGSHMLAETDDAVVGLFSTTEEREGTDAVIARAEAKVKSVDTKTRVVVLQTSDGKEYPLKVSQEVKRLNEIKPGDTVVAEYFSSVVHELRPPTEEEMKRPLKVLQDADREPASSAPGAYAVRNIQAVVTVTGVDKSAGTVDVQGPEGRTVRIQARRPERLAQVKAGDKMFIEYTEGVAVNVQPAAKK